jgi:hypothetical protein
VESNERYKEKARIHFMRAFVEKRSFDYAPSALRSR